MIISSSNSEREHKENECSQIENHDCTTAAKKERKKERKRKRERRKSYLKTTMPMK
jgi:hypothetical protein